VAFLFWLSVIFYHVSVVHVTEAIYSDILYYLHVTITLLFPLLQINSSASFFTSQVTARNKIKSDDYLLKLKDTNLKKYC